MGKVELHVRTEYVEIVGSSKCGRLIMKIGTDHPPHSKQVIMTPEEATTFMSELDEAIKDSLPEIKSEGS